MAGKGQGHADPKPYTERGSRRGGGLGWTDELTLKLEKVRGWFWNPWADPTGFLEAHCLPLCL